MNGTGMSPPRGTLNGMDSSEYVTGWAHSYVDGERDLQGRRRPMLVRTPHAIPVGSGEPPVQAICRAQVDEVSARAWPPGQHLNSMQPECGQCRRLASGS